MSAFLSPLYVGAENLIPGVANDFERPFWVESRRFGRDRNGWKEDVVLALNGPFSELHPGKQPFQKNESEDCRRNSHKRNTSGQRRE